MASVLITGASRGIGYATSLGLARAGHTVFATMRSPTRAPELERVAEEDDLPITVYPMDVDSDESVSAALAAVGEAHGTPDVLVNNAGIERRGSTEELDLAEFRAVMETNYFGALRCIQGVLPEMRSRGSGCIINITSVAGRIASAPLHPYAASKFALEALSEGLAQEVKAFGIRVAIVEPGIIDTDMSRSAARPAYDSMYPHMRRFASMFEASLEAPVGPDLVAEKIVEIVESDTWTLRHPVGPDAEGFLGWRASMSDEEWVEWWGIEDDEEWYQQVERDLGLKARPQP